jgi:hypothetical protein
MSVFTNPSGAAPEQAAAYIHAVLGLVEGKDPLEILRETPGFIQELVAAVPSVLLHAPERPGKWSIGAVVLHLADSEVVWGWRLRLVLAEDRPILTGYDQDLWAQRLGYDDVDVEEALETFTALRRSHLRLLSRATPEDLTRHGLHAERGEETVEHMTRLYAGHDLAHRNQLVRVRDAVASHLSGEP